MRQVKPPIAETRRPHFKLPPAACDTHLHVYGPFDRYPLAPDRRYDPDPRSTLDDYLNTHATLGLERAVIVTGSANGTNNQITLDAIARMKGRFKGLALLDPDVTDAELEKLRSGGITGFRIKGRNPSSPGGMRVNETPRMIERTQGFDWHIEFMSESMQEVIATTPLLSSLNVPYVFDHVAHAEPDQHKHGEREFTDLIAILKNEEHAWINLYSFYQLSKSGAPDYTDMVEVIQTIIAARPDHVIWGSNWPHGNIRVPTPNDGDLVDFLLAAAPDEITRNKILSDNPARLYGWK
jgi:predicted TIM-barrel fold metal-dependent hydrolase